MRHPISISILLLLILPCFYVTAQEKPAAGGVPNTGDLSLYADALDLLLAGNEDAAIPLLKRFIAENPGSAYVPKAAALLARYENRRDHSGIVSFYLGNLGTALFISEGLPMGIFETNDPVTLGLTGLIGVGAGLGSAWFMSRDIDMSMGQDLWIETIEAMSMANFYFAYRLLNPWPIQPSPAGVAEQRTWYKIQLGGLMAASVLGRGVAYMAVKDSLPSPGRASLFATTYLWSQIYYSMFMNGIVQSRNAVLNDALAIVIPDLLAVGSYFLYDGLNWSMLRTGLMSVGGLGGALIGGFAALVINTASAPAVTSMIMGSSLAGQVLAAVITSGMEGEAKTVADAGTFFLYPTLTSGRPGIAGRIVLK